MKHNYGKDQYTKLCSRNERRNAVWMKVGPWKLRQLRGGIFKGYCLSLGKENSKHMLLRCPETKMWISEF
jgi:hypothetical protein